MRLDFNIISDFIPSGSKVLDVGCGDGSLLRYLQESKNISARGIEIDVENVKKSLQNGVAVIQGDADDDLQSYPTNGFDFVILSQTLQATRFPEKVMKELQRIAEFVIVSVPNFSYFENRFYFLFRGKMPVTKTLPYQWYNTPNIHFCSLKDFVSFIRSLNFLIEKEIFINEDLPCQYIPSFLSNFFAKKGIFLLKRGKLIELRTKKPAKNLSRMHLVCSYFRTCLIPFLILSFALYLFICLVKLLRIYPDMRRNFTKKTLKICQNLES